MNITVSKPTANASLINNVTKSTTEEDRAIEDSEQYLMSLMGEIEDDLWWDMLIPSCVAVVATICVYITRRLRMIQEEEALIPVAPLNRPNNIVPQD